MQQPSAELVTQQNAQQVDAAVLERVLLTGDLTELKPEQRIVYYRAVCDSLHLNPLTKPFDYLSLDGKTVLYAKKDCADQLRTIHDISITIVGRDFVDGVYAVTAQATKPNGRTDESIGAVPLVKAGGQWKTIQGRDGKPKRIFEPNGTFTPLGPDEKANAIMKAETKSKRRVTLSICGLGFLDETEIETIPGAAPVVPQEQQTQPDQQQQQQPKSQGKRKTDPQQAQLERVRILNELRADYDKLGCQHQFEAIWNEYPWRVPSEVPKTDQSREMVQRLRDKLAELRAKLEVTDADAITDDRNTWVPQANNKAPAQTAAEMLQGRGGAGGKWYGGGEQGQLIEQPPAEEHVPYAD